MIRSYKKKPIKIENLNYQKLLILTVKEKYFSLFVGLLVSFMISSLTYKILKNLRINLAFKLPAINFASKTKITENKAVVQKPLKTYVTQEGDDLWHIAEKFYRSGYNYVDIMNENNMFAVK